MSQAITHIDVDGATLAVCDSGQGEPILLIHAYPMRHQLYRDVIGPLSETNRVIACDNRGFGASTVTAGKVSIEQYADDLVAVLDELAVEEPVAVAGVSMGGYIAMRMADRHPARVAGLFLCNTRAAADSPDAAAKRESLAVRIESERSQFTKNVPEKLLGETTQRTRPELVEELQGWILETDPHGIAAALRGMAERPDSTELIKSFERPIHFLGGTEDTFTPADEMFALAAETRRPITVLEASGHLSPIEQPEAWVDAFTSFLATTR